MAKLLIVGCGYVGQQVARRWRERGAAVTALSRGGAALPTLEQLGIPVAVADWLEPAWELRDADFDTALVAVPHRPDERYGVQTHAVGLAQLVKNLPQLQRLVVLSTTGVYHQARQPNRRGPDHKSPARLSSGSWSTFPQAKPPRCVWRGSTGRSGFLY
jgi:nucleoside-diphosphate-sugar epimerase